MRVEEAEAWLKVPPEEKLNFCHSDESMFPLCGTANQKNNVRWALHGNHGGEGRPFDHVFHKPTKSRQIMVFLGVHSSGKCFGLHFFEEKETLTGEKYQALLEEKIFPEIEQLNTLEHGTLNRMWWQQDGAPAHKTKKVKKLLAEKFGNRQFALGNTAGAPQHAPCSCDFAVLDIFVWPELKRKVYVDPMPRTIEVQF